MKDIPNISFDLIIFSILVYENSHHDRYRCQCPLTSILSVLDLFIVFNDRHECVKKSASRTSGLSFSSLFGKFLLLSSGNRILCCLCWKRNNYEHCTRLGLFDASIQLEFISTHRITSTKYDNFQRKREKTKSKT